MAGPPAGAAGRMPGPDISHRFKVLAVLLEKSFPRR
jgi:hypothetical protein